MARTALEARLTHLEKQIDSLSETLEALLFKDKEGDVEVDKDTIENFIIVQKKIAARTNNVIRINGAAYNAASRIARQTGRSLLDIASSCILYAASHVEVEDDGDNDELLFN